MRFSLFTLSCTVAFILLAGCDKAHQASSQKIAEPIVQSLAMISPQFGTFSTQILATASIQPSPDGIVSITAPVTGTVNKIHVTIGDKISKNSPLITIRSSDISDVDSDRL